LQSHFKHLNSVLVAAVDYFADTDVLQIDVLCILKKSKLTLNPFS